MGISMPAASTTVAFLTSIRRRASTACTPRSPTIAPSAHHHQQQRPATTTSTTHRTPHQLTAWELLLEPLMGVHISAVVAAIASVPCLAAWALRHTLPLPANLVLWHIGASGLLVAVAATETLAGRTTGIMGKVGRVPGPRAGGSSGSRGRECAGGCLPRVAPPTVFLAISRLPSLSPYALQRADGTINPLHFALLWPYHVGLRAKLALQRRLSSEPSFDSIGEHYYIGAWPSEEKLVPTVQPAVLDVTCELPLQVVPPAYLNLAVWDTHAPTPAQIEQGVKWALQQRAAGRSVLVHCAHGHGRSATVLAAILIGEWGAAQCGVRRRVCLVWWLPAAVACYCWQGMPVLLTAKPSTNQPAFRTACRFACLQLRAQPSRR
jgi:hypothetical protein